MNKFWGAHARGVLVVAFRDDALPEVPQNAHSRERLTKFAIAERDRQHATGVCSPQS
jgi:hypothetical protein